MKDFKEKLKTARDEREQGDVKKAIELFLEIDKSKLDLDELFTYLGEFGLSYYHAKDYENALLCFNELKTVSRDNNNLSYTAAALRQLSRPEFNEKTPEQAVKYAKEARDLAFNAKREDLVWFDHGVVKALEFNKKPLEDIKSWFEIEAKDLYEVSQFVKDELAKWVWVCGLLMDRAMIFNTKSDLIVALLIADHFNLAIRKKQIQKLIDEFDK